MSRAPKRKRRVSRVKMDYCKLVGTTLEFYALHNDCQYVTKIELGEDDLWAAFNIHTETRNHVKAVCQQRESGLKYANETLADMGGQS